MTSYRLSAPLSLLSIDYSCIDYFPQILLLLEYHCSLKTIRHKLHLDQALPSYLQKVSFRHSQRRFHMNDPYKRIKLKSCVRVHAQSDNKCSVFSQIEADSSTNMS